MTDDLSFKFPSSSRNLLFDRAVNSCTIPQTTFTRGLSSTRTHPQFLREVIHFFPFPLYLSSFFFFGILRPGPHQVRLGLCPIKRPSFSPHTASHISVWRGGKRERVSPGRRKEEKFSFWPIVVAHQSPPFGLSFWLPPSPSIQVFRLTTYQQLAQ